MIQVIAKISLPGFGLCLGFIGTTPTFGAHPHAGLTDELGYDGFDSADGGYTHL